VAAVGVAVAALAVRSEPWDSLVTTADPSDAERLVSLLTHVDNARVVGRAYLRAFPDEGSVSGLVDGIASTVPGGRGVVRRASAEDLARALSSSIRSDFAQEASVTVRGWILSKTEARLYALAALV
jgi:hypothetical protein